MIYIKINIYFLANNLNEKWDYRILSPNSQISCLINFICMLIHTYIAT